MRQSYTYRTILLESNVWIKTYFEMGLCMFGSTVTRIDFE